MKRLFAWLNTKTPGLTYWSKHGFSINEGEIPNIHIAWGQYKGFYICLAKRIRLHKFWGV